MYFCSLTRQISRLITCAVRYLGCLYRLIAMCIQQRFTSVRDVLQEITEHVEALKPAVAELARLETLAQAFFLKRYAKRKEMTV